MSPADPAVETILMQQGIQQGLPQSLQPVMRAEPGPFLPRMESSVGTTGPLLGVGPLADQPQQSGGSEGPFGLAPGEAVGKRSWPMPRASELPAPRTTSLGAVSRPLQREWVSRPPCTVHRHGTSSAPASAADRHPCMMVRACTDAP